MRTLVGIAALIVATGVAGCSCSAYQRISTRPCPSGSGSYELWCDGITRCEYRTSTGITIPCGPQDSAECVDAAASAALLCDSPFADVPLPIDAPLDGRPRDGGMDAPVPCPEGQVDLLFLIDNSNSMSSEQAALRAEIPHIIRTLSDYDLHVGVVTSDLGAGAVPAGEVVPSCREGLGDDGILRSTSMSPSCPSTFPSRVFSYSPGADPMVFARDVACVTEVGTGGCGFEQQLEVMLKALSPSTASPSVASWYRPPVFFGGTLGHGDGPNEGLLRRGSVLAIVPLTDEDDCSVPDYSIFYASNPVYFGNPLGLRCSRFPESLYSTERYVEGFLQLRESPRHLIYWPIAGIPPELSGGRPEAILADPRMQEIEDTSTEPPVRLVPSCDTPSGIALPPRRIVSVAAELERRGARVGVHSICRADYRAATDALVGEIVSALSCR